MLSKLLVSGHYREVLRGYIGEQYDEKSEKETPQYLSLYFIVEVLKKIGGLLRLSETTLTREIEQWEEKANAEQTKQNDILQNSKTGGGGGNILFNVVWPHQKEGLVCLLLKERAEKAKDVFSKAQDILDVRIEFLTDMINILQSAKNHGAKSVSGCENNASDGDNNDIKKLEQNRVSNAKPLTNIVEIPALDLKDGFCLEYKHLKELKKLDKEIKNKDDFARFSNICNFIQGKRRLLDEYLIESLNEIDKLSKDQHIKVERTECQKKIDKLIELST